MVLSNKFIIGANLKKNMGTIDRTIRIIVAILIAILCFTNVFGGFLAIILGIIALILIITSFIAVCPLYPPLKINTMKKKE